MKRTFTYEHALYCLAFLIALALRLFRLSVPPLGDVEAGWALQSLALARGGQVVLGPQPAYVLLTSLLFWLFGSLNGLARLLPAFSGSLLVFLPLLFRPWMGESSWLRKAGLALAFGLALDPALAALSRQAGSPIPALAFGLLALALLFNRRMVLAGIEAGLVLLSGPAVIEGALALALAWGAYKLTERRWAGDTPAGNGPQLKEISASEWRSGLLALGATLLCAGLLFLRIPQGLGAWAATLPAYLQGWYTSSQVPALRLPAALLFYQPLALIFGLIGAVRGWWRLTHGTGGGRLAVFLSLWALIALGLTLLYPGRQASDLVWVLVPLWALAALELTRYLFVGENLATRLTALGLAALWLLMLIIAWLNLLSMARLQATPLMFLLIIVGALLMALIATLLVAAGWSLPAAWLGVVWGISLGLGLGMLSSIWGLTQLHPNSARELWNTAPEAGQVNQLLTTLHDLSDWNSGLSQEYDLVVMADSPSMRWALRNFTGARFVSTLAASESPPVVITLKEQQTPSLAQSYRGEDLIWQVYPGWQEALPPNWVAWLAYRQAPVSQQQVILWARADQFPGGASNLGNSSSNSGSPAAPAEQQSP